MKANGQTDTEMLILTRTAETLLAYSDQHVQTKITVGRLVEVFQSPYMLPIIFHILHRT